MARRCIIFTSIIMGILGILCTGCVYRPDVQQGNILVESKIKSLHNGMSINQVRLLLGDPLLVNIYRDNRMVYVYTFQQGHEDMKEKRLIIYLKNGQVVDYWFDTNLPRASVELPRPTQ